MPQDNQFWQSCVKWSEKRLRYLFMTDVASRYTLIVKLGIPIKRASSIDLTGTPDNAATNVALFLFREDSAITAMSFFGKADQEPLPGNLPEPS